MKMMLSAITAAVVLGGGLVGCASSTKAPAGAPADQVSAADCPGPRNAAYSSVCAASRKGSPTAPGVTSASYGQRECPWPNVRNAKGC
jgi:hypothetical protein